jgi:hypothetical protein
MMKGTGSSKMLLNAYFLACLKPSSFILHIVYYQTQMRKKVVDVLTTMCILCFIEIKYCWQYGEFLILAKFYTILIKYSNSGKLQFYAVFNKILPIAAFNSGK